MVNDRSVVSVWLSAIALVFATAGLSLSIWNAMPRRNLTIGQVQAEQIFAKRFYVRSSEMKTNVGFFGFLPQTPGMVNLILRGKDKSAVILAADSAGTTSADMWDGKGTGRIRLISEGDRAQITVADQAGTARAGMVHRQKYPAIFVVYDADGNVRWHGTDEDAIDRKVRAEDR